MTAVIAAELLRRGTPWGALNDEFLAAMRTNTRSPQNHGGPSTEGRQPLGDGAYRRVALPAP